MKLSHLTLTVAAFLAPTLLTGQNAPETSEASGLARIERVRDQVRRSGFQPSLLNELTIAEAELQISYQAFRTASNEAEAAASLVGMGDAERMARIFLLTTRNGNGNEQLKALEKSARSHYEEAAVLARKAGSAVSLVKALTGMALIDESQHDYGTAN